MVRADLTFEGWWYRVEAWTSVRSVAFLTGISPGGLACLGTYSSSTVGFVLVDGTEGPFVSTAGRSNASVGKGWAGDLATGLTSI